MTTPIKLLITGPTGTAGSEVLRQALLHPSISQITVLTRRPLPPHIAPSPPNSKLNVILHSDYESYPPSLLTHLEGYQAVIWAQGISAVGMSEKDYTKITVDYPLAAAKAFAGLGEAEGGEKFVFVYLSGHGTDQVEGKASQMFGRVKGRAERALALLPTTFPSLATYTFRPAGILPVEPIPEAGRLQRFVTAIAPVFKLLLPSMVIDTPTLARGMIEAALKGGSGSIAGWEGKGKEGNEGTFSNEEIKKLAKSSVLAAA